MALPGVSISIKSGGLGLVAQVPDRVVGLVVNGSNPGVSVMYEAPPTSNAPLQPEDAEKFRQIADFYRIAGKGAELWICEVSSAIGTADLFTNGTIASLLDQADGRINVLGVSRYVYNQPNAARTAGINTDTYNALDEAHALAVSYASQHRPLRVIMDGKHYEGNVAALGNMRNMSYNRVGVLLAANNANANNSCMGLLLGRVASIPVQRNLGRVKDGAMSGVSVGYLTNGARADRIAVGELGTIHDKGYIFLRKHTGKGGFFFNDDPMCAALTDDYFSLSNGRVIDKAHRIAYATFLEELLDNVLVDERTGKIVPTVLKYYESKIERAIDLEMTAKGEISGVQAFVDPNQDILATSTLNVELRITPVGTNRTINVTIGLYNPNAA